MDNKIFQFTEWIYLNYGRAGCAVCLLIIISILALIFIFLNRLPESKIVTVWSKCSTCKYKRKESNTFVLACPKYEAPRFIYFRSPLCPQQNKYAGCQIIENQSDPAFIHRDNLLENIRD